MIKLRHIIAAPFIVLLAVLVGKVLGSVIGFMFFVFGGGAWLFFGEVAVDAFHNWQLRIRGPADLTGMEPEQQFRVLSNEMGFTGDPGSFSATGELAIRIRGVEHRAQSDPSGAIPDAERLAEDYPRSPAPLALVARLHRLAGSEEEEGAAGGRAVRVALNGGMNAVAARSFGELSRPARERMGLSVEELERVARALDANGDADGAQWCREAAGERDDDVQ